MQNEVLDDSQPDIRHLRSVAVNDKWGLDRRQQKKKIPIVPPGLCSERNPSGKLIVRQSTKIHTLGSIVEKTKSPGAVCSVT
jgi:hypothetical protein